MVRISNVPWGQILPPYLCSVSASVRVEGAGTVEVPDIPGVEPGLGRTGPGGWIVRSYEDRQASVGSTGGERMFHHWKVFR